MSTENLAHTIRRATVADTQSILKIIKNLDIDRNSPVDESAIDIDFFYVAEVNGEVIGISGYKFLGPKAAVTTFLGVLPEYKGKGIGYELQAKRVAAVKSLNCNTLYTATPTRESADWYIKNFNYVEIGGNDNVISLMLKLNSIHELNNEAVKDIDPLIINCCLTGGVHTKSDNLNLPVTPEEIINDAIKVWELGASIVHIHARDKNGSPTFDATTYEKIIYGIREKTDLIINVSTSARAGSTKEQRATGLLLTGESKPDMASLTVGSHNFINQANANPPDAIKYLADMMLEKGIKPELEIFEIGMLDYATHLIKKGILKMPLYINALFNSPGTMLVNPRNIYSIIGALPVDTTLSMAGIGSEQLNVMRWAVSNGKHVRIGLEDNLWLDSEKTELASNTALVQHTLDVASIVGRKIATPAQARKMIGL